MTDTPDDEFEIIEPTVRPEDVVPDVPFDAYDMPAEDDAEVERIAAAVFSADLVDQAVDPDVPIGHARVSTALGDIDLPLSAEQWTEAVAELDDPDGWDVGIVCQGVADIAADGPPVLVGVVYRVPGVADPMKAVSAAQTAHSEAIEAGMVKLPQGRIANVKLIVCGLDEFGE